MVCNSGVGLSPIVNGKAHQFGHRGLFNGLSVLGDYQTGSYWDHITGRCIHGPLLDYQLDVSPLSHTHAAQVLESRPEALLAISKQRLFQRLMGRVAEWTRLTKRGFVPPGFRKTMGRADRRLPRMQIGLGVWTDDARRFYPIEQLKREGNLINDQFDRRTLVVYMDPSTRSPAALFNDLGKAAWECDTLVLGAGRSLQDGVVHDARGQPVKVQRPMQVFTRWYGFSYTFPGCEIYAP